MKISNARLTLEKAIYIVVISLAAWLRLGNLNKLPLTDSESVYALAAVGVTSEASPFWHSNEEVVPLSPAYHSLTALVFHLVGASDANARIIPALAGLMLVLTPLLTRRRLGRSPTLLITVLFAISPVLITTARTAGGTSLATLGIVAMIASLLGKEKGNNERLRITLAGAAFGLALASGVSIFHGLLTLILVALYLSITQSKNGEVYRWIRRDQFRWGIWIAVGAMIVVAIGFGFSFSGLAGLGEAFAEWVSGWGASVEMSPMTGLAILLIYEPLLLVFGLAGAVVALRNRDKHSVGALTWAIGGILVMVVYPARQAADLVWVVIPLCLLAARAGISLIERLAHRSSWLEFIGLISFLLTLMTFTYLQFAAYASGINLIPDTVGNGVRLSIYLGLLLMGVVVIILFGLGWSWSLAGESLGFAGCIALLILTIAAGWRLNFAPTVSGANELWRPQVSTQGLRLMVETLETISQSYTGRTDAMEVKVIGPATPSLAWALRYFRLADLSGEIMTNPVPVVLVRAGEEWPILEAQYTGQELKIGEYWGWDGILPLNPIAWWIQRHAPTVEESWILFVRLDIISLGEMDWTGDEVVP